MPSFDIVKTTSIVRTSRVMQLEGMFDLPISKISNQEWHVDFELPEEWSIGVIVGPSGAGKSTVARALFGDEMTLMDAHWPNDRSLVDGFDDALSIKQITEMLSSVGFSSPPSWLKPYDVLSNGEKFRADLARTIAHSKGIAVVDEFTSVVDRQVAQIGSAAVGKTVRRMGKKFVAVTCHYDVIEWLDPDWIYEPHINKFTRRSLRGRPTIDFTVRRVDKTAWEFFMRHHYLTGDLHKTSRCFVGYVDGAPAVFGALLHFPHAKVKNYKREHRIVCLPDFQGIGLGNAFSAALGSMCRALDFRYLSITTHPAMIRARAKSGLWNMKRAPNFGGRTMPKGENAKKGLTGGNNAGVSTRLRASFEYIGPAMNISDARRLWDGD